MGKETPRILASAVAWMVVHFMEEKSMEETDWCEKQKLWLAMLSLNDFFHI